MSRIRANDYDEKATAIMDNAAALFASAGFANTKLQDVAKACGATKSMLYHYFPTKDDLLCAVLIEHLEQLLSDIESVAGGNDAPEQKFRRFIIAYVQKSAASRQRHVSAMNDVKYLPQDKRGPIVWLEREVITASATILSALRPDFEAALIKAYTLLLLGMLNWTDLWYDRAGRFSPDELCDRISHLFLNGFKDACLHSTPNMFAAPAADRPDTGL